MLAQWAIWDSVISYTNILQTNNNTNNSGGVASADGTLISDDVIYKHKHTCIHEYPNLHKL